MPRVSTPDIEALICKAVKYMLSTGEEFCDRDLLPLRAGATQKNCCLFPKIFYEGCCAQNQHDKREEPKQAHAPHHPGARFLAR
jgi:hypothetical protein